MATLPGLLPSDIDIDFYDDILGNINGALFLVGGGRKGRLGVVADIAYVDYKDGAFLNDVAQDGLTLGLSWRF